MISLTIISAVISNLNTAAHSLRLAPHLPLLISFPCSHRGPCDRSSQTCHTSTWDGSSGAKPPSSHSCASAVPCMWRNSSASAACTLTRVVDTPRYILRQGAFCSPAWLSVHRQFTPLPTYPFPFHAGPFVLWPLARAAPCFPPCAGSVPSYGILVSGYGARLSWSTLRGIPV